MMVVIVGAGISGASLARMLADRGIRCVLIESSEIVGGMCREITWNGWLVPEFGPHIFRTSAPDIWHFVQRFTDLVEKRHDVLTVINEKVLPFPPLEGDGSNSLLDSWHQYSTLGDFLVEMVGNEIFQRYYKHYTLKRWGVSAFELSADIAPLIPIFRFKTGFFQETRIGTPREGYTRAIENMIDHELIEVILGKTAMADDVGDFDVVVWTGRPDILPVRDRYQLPYRSILQQFEQSDHWGSPNIAVLNYPGPEAEYIRRTNYEILLPWAPKVIGTEYSAGSGYPAYPVRTKSAVADFDSLQSSLQRDLPKFVLHGRAGRFQYIGIDAAIRNSFVLADQIQSGRARYASPRVGLAQ
jgi:UDP-galactopyranose mutase